MIGDARNGQPAVSKQKLERRARRHCTAYALRPMQGRNRIRVEDLNACLTRELIERRRQVLRGDIEMDRLRSLGGRTDDAAGGAQNNANQLKRPPNCTLSDCPAPPPGDTSYAHATALAR